MDLLDVERDLLRAGGFNAYTKRLDETTGEECMVVRRMPPTLLKVYHDGKRVYEYPFQVIVRMRSELQAIEDADEAMFLLDGAKAESMDGSYTFRHQDIYTTTQPLGLDEKGFYAYEFKIMAVIEIGWNNHDSN